MSRVFKTAISANWHAHMLSLMKELGYRYDPNGVCFGLASTAAVAHLSGKMDIFEESLAILSHAEASTVKKAYAGLTQKEFIDLLAFLDSVALHQETEKFKHIFPSAYQFHDQSAGPMDLSTLLKLKLETDETIAHLDTICRLYTRDDLRRSMDALEKQCHSLENGLLSLIVTKVGHGISIHYDPKTKQWMMIDSNRPGGKEGPLHRTFESDDIADFIWESLAEHVGGEPQCLIDLQLLCNKKDHPEIKKAMDPWINSGNDAMFADKKLEILTIEEKSALLTLATRVGDIKAIQALLKFKPTVGPSFVDERYLQFDSPLTVAIRFGHAEVVKLLLDSGASLNTGAHHEAFLWQQAITHDRIDILRMLLNHPLSTQNFSRVQTRPPLLNFIAKHGDTDLMSRLLQNRTIDPNFQPHNGDTPLHCAALNGQLDTVKLLMRDPQINPNLNDYYGNTAFHLAQIKASYAKEVAEKQRFIEIAEAIKNHPKFIESMHSDGSPLLHYHIERHTAGSDLTEIIRLISDGDYPRNERDKEGHSALFYALQKDPDLSVDLVRSGFEINEIDSISEKHILAMALYSGFDNVFAVALERLSRDKKAFDINYRSDDDRGFLQYALDCGNYAIANLILTHEVELVFSDFAWTDPKGKSVLHLSMFHMSDLSAEKIIKKMRELNLPLDRRDKLNNTAFFYAIQEKKMDGAKLIMDSCEGSQVLYSELARLLSVIQSYSWERSNKPLAMALDMFKVMTTFRELYLKEGDQILTNHPYSSLAPVAPTLKILSELASISFDPLKLPQSNDSLLHQAIATENIELLDMLLENEIIKNELMQSSHPVNTDNKSPLEVALQMKSPIIVIKLIKAGASFVEAFEDATYETCGHLEELSLALKNDDKVVKEEVIKAAEMIDARYDLKIKELILDHNQIAPETERVGIRDVKKF